jgi:hypothetical protein
VIAPKKIIRSPQRRRMESRDQAAVTTIALAKPVHQQLRVLAVKLNWTFSEIMRHAATEWLERHAGDVR